MEFIKAYSVKAMIDRFLGLYTPESSRWDDISALSEKLQWISMANQTASEYFGANGVAQLFTQELVEAATRVNYGQVRPTFSDGSLDSGQLTRHQNVDKIHAFGGVISMAANGASSIAAGNLNIFEHFLKNSSANVFLNTNVGPLSLQIVVFTESIPGREDPTDI